MLNAISVLRVVNWIYSQLYVNCDIIHCAVLPQDVQTLPGNSDFAYVISAQFIYFIDKKQRIANFVQVNEEEARIINESLKIQVPPNRATKLIEENASIERIRTLIALTRMKPPFTFLPILNAVVIFGFFGFIPYAWFVSVPLSIAYLIYKRQQVSQNVVTGARRLVGSFRHFAQHAGEWMGDKLALQPATIIKALSSLAIFLMLGVNSWSLIGIYGIYRFPEEEWLKLFNNGLASLYDLGFGFFNRTLGRASFYKRLGAMCAVAVLLGTQAYTGGVLALVFMGVFIVQMISIAVGFKALFRDMAYILKNPIKAFFASTGRILGAITGRFLAYQVFTGHVEGTLGPAIGHVVNNGLFSGFLSSFLLPGGWFTTETGIFGLLIARIQNFLNTVVTSVFVTTEMQTQGIFFGTVGPTLLQVFFFIGMGYILGGLIEKTVNRVTRSVKDDSGEIVASTQHTVNTITTRAKQSGHFTPLHIGFVAAFTPMILVSPGGATMLALAGGSMFGAAALTAACIIGTYAGLQLIGYGIAQGYARVSDRQSNAQLRNPPELAQPEINLEAPQTTFTPAFNQQREEQPRQAPVQGGPQIQPEMRMGM